MRDIYIPQRAKKESEITSLELSSVETMASSSTYFSSQIALITVTTIFILSSSSSSASATTPTKGTQNRPFKKIYAFGDSFTDTGNTDSATGPTGFRFVSNPPYGTTFFHHPTNRYSDGRLVIDFVAQELSLPFLQPYLYPRADVSYGVNFAVAGSTAIIHDFFVQNNLSVAITPESIQTQLLWFNNFLGKDGCKDATTTNACNAVFANALIWVGEIGVNDYAYTIGSTVPWSTIQKLSLRSVTRFLKAILKKGAKYVVVQGLPPTGCQPLYLVPSPEDDRDEIGCVGSVNKLISTHNTILQAKLHDLHKQFPHAIIAYADYWNAYYTVMKNPSMYGIKEQFKACCGKGGNPYNFNISAACGSPNVTSCPNPSQYINWDGVHLTEGMHKVISDMFLHGKSCHPPFDDLLNRKNHTG